MNLDDAIFLFKQKRGIGQYEFMNYEDIKLLLETLLPQVALQIRKECYNQWADKFLNSENEVDIKPFVS